jgi:hypothetical protein
MNKLPLILFTVIMVGSGLIMWMEIAAKTIH